MSKSIFFSKVLWVNILTVATVVASVYGVTPDQELADKVAAFLVLANPIINVVLRYFTTKAVTILRVNRNPNKAKHKARRTAEETRRQTARSNALKTIEKWTKEYYESRQDYPVTKTKRRKLTWSQYKKLLKK